MIDLSIGVLTFSKLDTLRLCLDKLERCNQISNYTLTICADSISSHMDLINYPSQYLDMNRQVKEYIEFYKQNTTNIYKNIEIIHTPHNLGPAASCKFLIDHMFTKTEWILFLEDDILVNKDALTYLVTTIENAPEEFAYCISPIFEHPDISLNNIAEYANKKQHIDWISSTDFAISKHIWDKYGHIRGEKSNGDSRFGYYMRENGLTSLCPMISRCTRIGQNHEYSYSKHFGSTDHVHSYIDINSDHILSP